MIVTARMKFASKARPSQYIVPFASDKLCIAKIKKREVIVVVVLGLVAL